MALITSALWLHRSVPDRNVGRNGHQVIEAITIDSSLYLPHRLLNVGWNPGHQIELVSTRRTVLVATMDQTQRDQVVPCSCSSPYGEPLPQL